MSSPSSSASSMTTFEVFTPSATMFIVCDDLVDRLALAEPLADVAVAALGADAGGDQVAHAGQPEKVSGSPPRATPRRVSSARPRVMTAARVLSPAPRPSAMPDGDGDDVLQHAAHLAADDVLVRVHPEQVGLEDVLHGPGDVVVVHGHHAGGGVAGEDLLGQVGPGEHADGVAGQHLLDDLAHAQAGAELEALGEARSPAPTGAGTASPPRARPGSRATARPSPARRPGARPPPGRRWPAAASGSR